MRTILVVDDIPDYRDIFTRHLVKLQFNVIQSYDGAHALELLEAYQVDLIFLDYYMPRMDGFQTLEKLRQCPELSNIPVVMTSTDSLKNQIAVVQYGCVGWVRKPPMYDEIAKMISAINF